MNHAKRMNDAARRRGLNMGALGPHMTFEKLNWLALNVPQDMTVGEYLLCALLPDAMAEDAE